MISSKATFIVLFVLVLSVLGDEKYYVCDSTGADLNSCVNETLPCKSIQGALDKIVNNTVGVYIYVCPGFYTGDQNVQLTLSESAEFYSFSKYGTTQGHALFDCESTTDTFAFTSKTNLIVQDLLIANCTTGIYMDGSVKSTSLNAIETEFFNTKRGIYFNSTDGELSTTGCNFENNEFGIYSLNVLEFISSYNIFVNNQLSSISVTSESINEGVLVEYTLFEDTAGIFISGNTTGKFDSNLFINIINNDRAIEIIDGDWYIDSFMDTQNLVCFYYAGSYAHTLTFDGFSINTLACKTGVYITSPLVMVDMKQSRIASSDNCLVIDKFDGLSVYTSDFNYCYNSSIIINDVESAASIRFTDTEFFDCGPIDIHVATETQGLFDDCSFRKVASRALTISNGNWVFDNIDVDQSNTPFIPDDGGMFYLTSASGFGNYNISSSEFAGGYSGGNGGAIFAQNVSNFTISDSFFNNNAAANKGGAIYLDGFSNFDVRNCEFDDNRANNQGGAIFLESFSENTAYAFVNGCLFVNNEADYGSVMSCCSTDDTDCEIFVYQQNAASNTFEDNQYTTGDDAVECIVYLVDSPPPPPPASTDDDDNEETGDSTVYWIIFGSIAGAILLVVIVAIVIYGVVQFKKKSSYSSL